MLFCNIFIGYFRNHFTNIYWFLTKTLELNSPLLLLVVISSKTKEKQVLIVVGLVLPALYTNMGQQE